MPSKDCIRHNYQYTWNTNGFWTWTLTNTNTNHAMKLSPSANGVPIVSLSCPYLSLSWTITTSSSGTQTKWFVMIRYVWLVALLRSSAKTLATVHRPEMTRSQRGSYLIYIITVESNNWSINPVLISMICPYLSPVQCMIDDYRCKARPHHGNHDQSRQIVNTRLTRSISGPQSINMFRQDSYYIHILSLELQPFIC